MVCLHPNNILILSIFAYLCEAYISIRPSVELFRSFYALRNTAPNKVAECVSFRIADARSRNYIPMRRPRWLTVRRMMEMKPRRVGGYTAGRAEIGDGLDG